MFLCFFIYFISFSLHKVHVFLPLEMKLFSCTYYAKVDDANSKWSLSLGDLFLLSVFLSYFLVKCSPRVQQNGYTLWTTEWTLWIDGSTLMWGWVFFFALGINWVSYKVYACMPVGSYIFQNPNPFLLSIFPKSTLGPTSQPIILKL